MTAAALLPYADGDTQPPAGGRRCPLAAAAPPGRRYYAFSRFLRERFGTRVYRVTIDAGFTCPNVDGTVAIGGCVYCDNRSFSPNRRLPRTTVRAQVERGVALLRQRYGADRFLAYFQAATNTLRPGRQAAPPLRRGAGSSANRRPGHRHPARLRARSGARPDPGLCPRPLRLPGTGPADASTTARSTG